MSRFRLDPEHAKSSVENARLYREVTCALRQGKDRWIEVIDFVRSVEAHLQPSSAGRSFAIWKLAIVALRVLDCDHQLRALARTSSSRIAEESARLAVFLRELGECLTVCGSETPFNRFQGIYSLDPIRIDPAATLDVLSTLPLPILYYVEKEDTWGRRRISPPSPQEQSRPPLLKVIAFIDGSPLVCPQVLRPSILYSLRLRVRGSFWPAAADSLRLDLISTCPASSYSLSPFCIPRPTSNSDFEVEADGNVTFHIAQSPGSMNLAFTVRCRFQPEAGTQSETVVVGHHRLQFRVGDLGRLAIASGYSRMDARVLELLQEMERSTPTATSEFPQLLPTLEALASCLAVFSQRGVFKGNDKVQESEFQKGVVDFLRMKLGEEVQEHASQAGGVTDVRYRGVIVELKVERESGDRAAICKKYTSQPTQYEGSEARQVSVLLVLDLTEKTLPPGDIRNDILLVDAPTHGGGDSAKPYPSKAFVFILNGNIRSPSTYS